MKSIKGNETYILIMFLLFLPFFVFGQEPFQKTNIENPFKFNVVKELIFEKSIKDVAFGTIVKDKDTVIYPRIIVLNDEINCYNEKGKMLWSYKETSETFMDLWPYLSTNGKFILISADYLPTDVILAEKGTHLHFTKIFNDSGKQIWNRIDTLSENEKIAVVSDNGYFALLNINHGVLEFFDSLGKKVNEAQLRADRYWKRTGGAGIIFSDNGDRLSVFFTERTDSSMVVLYDKNGTELLRKNLRDITDVSLSPKGDFLLTICEINRRGTKDWRKYAILLNNEGNSVIERQIPLGANTYFKFSKDGNYAVLGVGFSIMLIKVKDGTVLWNKTLNKLITPLPDPAQGTLVPIDVSNNGTVVLATRDEKQLAIHIVNVEGSLLKNYVVDDLNCYRLKLSPDSKTLFSVMKNKIIEFSLEEK